MREKAYLREVGLRDGLQMVKCILSADRKVEWCREEAAAGVGEIEVTSFVPPKIVPQFADAVEVAERTGGIGLGGGIGGIGTAAQGIADRAARLAGDSGVWRRPGRPDGAGTPGTASAGNPLIETQAT